MTGMVFLALLLGWTAAYFLGRIHESASARRREADRRPFRFRWTCPHCGSWVDVACPEVDHIPTVESFLAAGHVCR